MRRIRVSLFSFVLAILLPAAAGGSSLLPGFTVQKVAPALGFVTSIAFDANGTLLYSVTDGGIYRLDADGSSLIVKVPTASIGNAVLLGIARRGSKIVAHYVAPDLTADIVSEIDPADGSIQELARIPCAGGQPCSSEHHGGNPAVGPDGSVYVGIGDFGFPNLAARDDSPAGRIFRIAPDGTVAPFARGFRNPYDLAVAPSGDFLIVGDNGAEAHDEVTYVREGENHGWPTSSGTIEVPEGITPPVYVFPGTIAPTGVTLVRGLLRSEGTGYLVASFVTGALYYFPAIPPPVHAPVTIFEDLPQLGGFNAVLDVVQSPAGDILFATAGAIWRLVPPARGDVDGDGALTERDLEGIAHELVDGDGDGVREIHGGTFAASWGADVNDDGRVNSSDLVAWVILAQRRGRMVVRE
ncbi:MAG TPA: PQQ-dependent sugar dehydrogenase [Thermoanaerobaculia bacterium]|nr:PQQ-dependent sugar dehydrogenase [Thermoanaerobaculia bacterium]